MNVLFNLLVMEEDKELVRKMLNLSPSIFDTELTRWIIKHETYKILFLTLTVHYKMSPVLSGPPVAVQRRAAVPPPTGFSSLVWTENSPAITIFCQLLCYFGRVLGPVSR